MSKLVRTGERILTKLEMNNPGGSHIYRAASFIIEAGLRSGDMVPGVTTVIEKTGGNFGSACWPLATSWTSPWQPSSGMLLEALG